MTQIDTVYKGHRLTAAIEPSSDAWVVEITPTTGGTSIRTAPFKHLADAVDEAHRMVDAGMRGSSRQP